MKELSKLERKILKTFIKIEIPEYIKNYSDIKIDMLECFEIGFTFANALLRNQKINLNLSPWGDGKSVIFEPYYTEFLEKLISKNLNEEINNYCKLYLKVLEIFKNHALEI